MGRSVRRWCRFLVPLLPVALVLVACSGAAGDEGVAAAPEGESAAVLTVNVDVTDDAFQPSPIRIPVGQRVQLVLRNRDSTEHHFWVQGLMASDLMWMAQPESDREEGVSDEDHAHHHFTSFVPWRGASPRGIKPTGHEVHAYARGGAMDVVLFTPTDTGTFVIQCPLHPEIVGKMIVSR